MPSVADHLRARGVEFELIPHAQTYTSIDEARALGISADEVLKTVVVKTASGYALAVVPGTRRLDMHLVRDAVGDKHTRLATEEELERDFPGYELGSIPPLGSLVGAPLYVDPEVMDHDTVLFAAGTQTESVKVGRGLLFGGEPLTVSPLARHPEAEDEKERMS
jgi:Ala-tRNA(Pro) deacylase